jgi:predicted RecA/RadA family phage recombinase
MKNYIQEGDTLTLPAPYAVVSGAGFQVGSIFAVAVASAAAGAPVEGQMEGVFTLPKISAQAWTIGVKVYWDDTNKRCDTTSSVGGLIGAATAVAANPSSSGNVRINGTAA